MAQQTVTSFLILTFLGKESPIDWNSARVTNNGFSHTPQEHQKKNMKDYKKYNVWRWFQLNQVLKNEDEVVEGDENKNSSKVRIDEFGTIDLAIAHDSLDCYFKILYFNWIKFLILYTTQHSQQYRQSSIRQQIIVSVKSINFYCPILTWKDYLLPSPISLQKYQINRYFINYYMFLSVYCLKTLISSGIVVTLLMGIVSLYVLVYAFLISSVTAQILPDFRNGFIATFMVTSVLMIISSLSGIYGLIRKRNKFVIGYSITMLIYFVVFVILAAFTIKYPTYLKDQCQNATPDINSIRQAVFQANKTLGKQCQCYFNNINYYSEPQKAILFQMGFTNYTAQNSSLPVNAQNCSSWNNQTYSSTTTMIFLQSVFNCSGWCQVNQQYNLYYLFTDVNRGKPNQSCIVSLLKFFDKFGFIMEVSCFVVAFVLFLVLLTIICLCCHPDRGQQYDAMKFFKSTLMVELNQQQQPKSSSS